MKNCLVVLGVCFLPFGLLLGQAQDQDKIVYPQAVVGSFENQTFEIDLRLGNRNPEEAWQGTIRLLRQENLQGMTNVRFKSAQDDGIEPNGEHAVTIPPNQSAVYQITSDTLQIGVMVIEEMSSDIADLVPSFFYQLYDQQAGSVTDLIAVQPATEPGVAFRAMIAETNTFDVGLAVVSQRGVSEEPTAETTVVLTAILADGGERSAATMLGGSEAGQKALFPSELIQDLPAEYWVAQLQVVASEPIYCAVLGVGTPPEFQDVQIGAAPALPDVSVLFLDDVESGPGPWTTAGSEGSKTWSIVTDSSRSSTSSWFAEDLGSISDQRLTMQGPYTVPDDGLPVFFSFWHHYSFEAGFDGGVVEISTDGAQSWQDTGPLMVSNSYHRVIPTDFDNPLGNRDSFSGTSPGDPDFIETVLDLSDLAGEQILIRFRVGTDSGGGGRGWHIDDIQIRHGAKVRKLTLFADDLESGTDNWTTAGSQGTATWHLLSTSRSPTHGFYARSVSSRTDQLLTLTNPIELPADARSASLNFWHQYDLPTGSDGVVVEISVDGGQSWLDTGSLMTLNPYDGSISANVDNPLAGRDAFTTEATNTWRRTTVDLTSFLGESLLIRFRAGTADGSFSRGWNLDDISVEAILK